MINLRNRIQEIRRSIVDELNQIAGAYKSDFDIAEAREKSVEQSLNATVTGSQTTNKAQIELRQLESAAQNYRTLYDSLQQRYNGFCAAAIATHDRGPRYYTGLSSIREVFS